MMKKSLIIVSIALNIVQQPLLLFAKDRHQDGVANTTELVEPQHIKKFAEKMFGSYMYINSRSRAEFESILSGLLVLADQEIDRKVQAGAWFRLGEIYMTGMHGVGRDESKAKYYFTLAKSQDVDSNAQGGAGYWLKHFEKDLVKLRKNLNPDDDSWGGAMDAIILAGMYSFGLGGLTKDLNKAAQLYEQARTVGGLEKGPYGMLNRSAHFAASFLLAEIKLLQAENFMEQAEQEKDHSRVATLEQKARDLYEQVYATKDPGNGPARLRAAAAYRLAKNFGQNDLYTQVQEAWTQALEDRVIAGTQNTTVIGTLEEDPLSLVAAKMYRDGSGGFAKNSEKASRILQGVIQRSTDPGHQAHAYALLGTLPSGFWLQIKQSVWQFFKKWF